VLRAANFHRVINVIHNGIPAYAGKFTFVYHGPHHAIFLDELAGYVIAAALIGSGGAAFQFRTSEYIAFNSHRGYTNSFWRESRLKP
jgi:hypothetical protein